MLFSLLMAAMTALIVMAMFMLFFFASRYKRCPSDMILVIYGNVGKGKAVQCVHGGGKFVWPIIQDHAWMSLAPITIEVPAAEIPGLDLSGAIKLTVAIGTEPALMQNAAERLLNLNSEQIAKLAAGMVRDSLRPVARELAKIADDPEAFHNLLLQNVEPGLNKVGLTIINT